MVAQTVELPNIRKLFIPDPGYTLVELDLQRAESQVVAWESGDPELKRIFHSGEDIHAQNAELTYRLPSNYFRRDRLKRCVYAIQNGGRAEKLGELLDDPTKGRWFYDYWTGRFPSIPKWHQKIEFDLLTRHCIENVWGYKRHYFDRMETPYEKHELLGKAIPWITQSTIATTINKSILEVEKGWPAAQFLLQVHDSVLWQVSTALLAEALPIVRQASLIRIPYPDPLIIPVTLKISAVSWGDVEEPNECPPAAVARTG